MDREYEYDNQKVLHFVKKNYQEYFSKDAEGFLEIFLSCLTQDDELFETSSECIKHPWEIRKFLTDFCLKFDNEFSEFEKYQICTKFFIFMQYKNDKIRERFFNLGQKIAEDNNLFKEIA